MTRLSTMAALAGAATIAAARGVTQTVRDSGTFSNGTPITHSFFVAANPNNGPATCAVRSVTLGDGSAWQAG